MYCLLKQNVGVGTKELQSLVAVT